MNRNAIELLAAAVAAAAFGFGLFEAMSYRGQSAYMPVAVTGLALAMALIWVGQSVWKLAAASAETFEVSGLEVFRFAVLCAVMVLYVICVARFGFFISTIVMVPGLAVFTGYRHAVPLAIGTLGFVAILFVVFRSLLSIPLPPDRLLTLLGIG